VIAHSDWPTSHRREGQSFDPHPLRPGCFFFVGTTKKMKKDEKGVTKA